MSFRARIAVAAAAAVALAVVLASILVFFVVRSQLRGQIDETLRERSQEVSQVPLRELPGGPRGSFLDIGFGEPNTYVQLVREDGTTVRPLFEDIELPVSERALALASSSAGHQKFFSDATVEGTHLRILNIAFGPGYVVQIARPLTEVDDALARLRLFLVIVALAGIAFAAVLGAVVSRAALRPVTSLTETAETVTETGDLSQRIEVQGNDELSRLATSFNTMLAALEESTRAQRQLVADASHELRTPLTSLRTNIEVLASDHALPPDERERLLSDVVEQLDEMTTLISELIELGRAEERNVEPKDVRLDLVTAEALERVQRNRPGVVFTTLLDDSVVRGVPSSLERAIGNLLDNAAKWSPPGAHVEVRVADGAVVVRDHGPGIADEDLPYVFDRFYRARGARGMSGSGLGLALVRKVAEAHGGEVVAERVEGGGTRMTMRLPRTPAHVAPSPEPALS